MGRIGRMDGWALWDQCDIAWVRVPVVFGGLLPKVRDELVGNPRGDGVTSALVG